MTIEDLEQDQDKKPEWAERLSISLVQSELDSTQEQVLGSAYYACR